MTHNARCPACSTVFAVTTDALGASDGWVRCGRCSEVFDAVAYRHGGSTTDIDSLTERLAKQLQLPVQMPSNYGARAASRPSRIEITTSAPDLTRPKGGPVPDDPGAAAFEPTVFADFSNQLLPFIDPLPERPAKSQRRKRNDGTAATKLDKAGRNESPKASRPNKASADPAQASRKSRRLQPEPGNRTSTPPATASEPYLSYTSASKRPPFFSRFAPRDFDDTDPQRLWLWSALAIGGLCVLLTLQFALTMRHELATHYPSSKTALEALCKPLGCSIDPLPALHAITIDSSSFQALPNSGGSLNFELKWSLTNQALYPVARPAFELTLNDVLDRPLIRKVLLPAELGAVEPQLAAEGTWVGAMNVRVRPPDGGIKISGYRLTAFYP